MDVNFLRAAITLLCFVAFLGIVWWAYGRGRRERFDEAANLPFADEEMQRRTIEADRREGALPGEGAPTERGPARSNSDGAAERTHQEREEEGR